MLAANGGWKGSRIEWSDEIRLQRLNKRPPHFIRTDIPVSAPAYNATRDCARDDCVVAQIERDVRISATCTLRRCPCRSCDS